MTKDQVDRMKVFQQQLAELITGTKEFVFIMDDPTGYSYLQVGTRGPGGGKVSFFAASFSSWPPELFWESRQLDTSLMICLLTCLTA